MPVSNVRVRFGSPLAPFGVPLLRKVIGLSDVKRRLANMSCGIVLGKPRSRDLDPNPRARHHAPRVDPVAPAMVFPRASKKLPARFAARATPLSVRQPARTSPCSTTRILAVPPSIATSSASYLGGFPRGHGFSLRRAIQRPMSADLSSGQLVQKVGVIRQQVRTPSPGNSTSIPRRVPLSGASTRLRDSASTRNPVVPPSQPVKAILWPKELSVMSFGSWSRQTPSRPCRAHAGSCNRTRPG